MPRKDVTMMYREVTDCPDRPGQSTVEQALVSRDTWLLRKIAEERKGLNDQQRNALSLIADLLLQR